MFRRLRLPVYVLVGAVLLTVSLAAPAAWATPGQSPAAQTVPTATAPAPTDAPDDREQPTAVPPPATPQPAATIQPAATAAAAPGPCTANSRLTLAADRRQVWPGATVAFTATLTNTGQQPLQQIVLENQLPAELEPQSVISGSGDWQGRALTVTSDALAPAARLTVVYSARVAAAPSGKGLVVRAAATSAGCPAKTASVTLGAPPSELPRTGGAIR